MEILILGSLIVAAVATVDLPNRSKTPAKRIKRKVTKAS